MPARARPSSTTARCSPCSTPGRRGRGRAAGLHWPAVSARPDSVLRPEVGPALPQLLRARLGSPVRGTRAVALAVVLAAVAYVLAGRGGEVPLVHRTPEPV